MARVVLVSPLRPSTLPLVAVLCLIGLVAQANTQQPTPPSSVRMLASPTLPIGTALNPGDDLGEKVAAAPAGTSFLIKAGVHRQQTIRPKDGNTFLGEPGAVLSGAKLLTTFQRSGALWYASGQTQQGTPHGQCQPGYQRCANPEQLFINDVLLEHVATLAEVGPGRWFFDYDQDRIYFADDPTGKRVETSVTADAFLNTANNVTISGLAVEKYANQAQYGPINAENTTGWVITSNQVRLNHGGGIRIGHRTRVIGNLVYQNGQIGVAGIGDDVLVEGNEISFNNRAHFDPGWEAGGTKFVLTKRLVVRLNFVHHNIGPGLWTDIDNIDTDYDGNRVEDNCFALKPTPGIFHEISFKATIRNNTVRRNGLCFPDWMWGAGILIAASRDVEVYGNTVEGNGDGIGAIQQNRREPSPYLPAGALHPVENLYVHDNVVRNNLGWSGGLVQDLGDTTFFTAKGNRFEKNVYVSAMANPFTWMNRELTLAQWVLAGQDVAK